MNRTLFAFVCMLAGAALTAHAQPKPPALPDAEEKFEPGLTLTFQSGATTDSRTARMVALYVPDNTSPTPFLPPGPFKATWTGNIASRSRDTINLSAAGRGTLKVSVNDQPALDLTGDDLAGKTGPAIPLKKGKNKLVVEYTSPAKGASELRLFWQAENFAAEPLPPTTFTHDTSDKPLREHARLRDGRTLLADLRCTKCHTPADKLTDASMPELSMDAPNLTDVGSRLTESYMAAWIENPKSLRPQATMPRLHLDSAQAKDIAAYLATLGAKSPAAPATDDAAVATGARTFTTLGCIACHTAPDAEKTDKPDPARIPHDAIRAKWQPAALVAFLKSPEKNYAWTRMPNFRLSDAEANSLAAYLLAKSPAKELPTGGDAARGAKLFTSSGCLNCHTAPGASDSNPPPSPTSPNPTSPPAASPRTTPPANPPPTSPSPTTSAPRSNPSPPPASPPSPTTTPSKSPTANSPPPTAPPATSATTSATPGPTSRKKSPGSNPPSRPAEDHGEKFAPDQSRPQLTWVGEKLKPDFATHFIAGKVAYKPRPYIQARMPGFPSRAAFLATGFAHQHGYSADPVKEPAPDAAAIPIAQRLVGKTGGFSCNACHAIADVPATAAFEAPAPNFAHVAERLRHDYYVRWVRNPQRVERGTRMPTFATADGKTIIRDVLDGDANKQFDAIWNYLLQGPKVQPPQ